MTITIASISNQNFVNIDNAYLYINKPTGLAIGDVMIAFICVCHNYGFEAPSGWTSIGTYSPIANGPAYEIFKKEATSDDVSASNFAFRSVVHNLDTRMFGSIYRISGADINNIQIGSPTKTPVRLNNVVILAGFGFDNDDDYCTFSGYSITGGASVSFTENRDYYASIYGEVISMGLASGIYSSLSDITAMTINNTGGVDFSQNVLILIPELPSAELDQSFFHFF